jgi:predicted homoserine dehydrogenase-like protein
MIFIDTALEKLAREGKQIRVGIVGAGFIGRGATALAPSGKQSIDVIAVAKKNLKAGEIFNKFD